MTDRTLLGVLVPSSNTRLEPETAEILRGLPGVSAHFSRFRVVDVGLAAAGQFDQDPILRAADLLADARVDSIVWSGTSGGWRGVDDDRALCAQIEEQTGLPATTSTIALLEAMTALGSNRLGLVTPYPNDMHAAVVATLGGEGIEVVADANDPFTSSNWELSLMTQESIEKLVAEVVPAQPDAVTIFCTNLVGADAAAAWEAQYGATILDSVSLAVWHSLELTSYSGPRPEGWGRLFSLVAPAR